MRKITIISFLLLVVNVIYSASILHYQLEFLSNSSSILNIEYQLNGIIVDVKKIKPPFIIIEIQSYNDKDFSSERVKERCRNVVDYFNCHKLNVVDYYFTIWDKNLTILSVKLSY